MKKVITLEKAMLKATLQAKLVAAAILL